MNDGVVGWVTLPMTHPNTGGDIDSRNQNLTAAAIRAADPYIDYAAYDTNGDGIIKPAELHVTVIVAGYEGSYSPACAPSVWGHRWGVSLVPIVDNKSVGGFGYTQFGEMHCTTYSPGAAHMATIGIMAHEFGHDLGWTDLYDPSGVTEGIGEWSLMAAGSWGTSGSGPDGNAPTLPDAYSKYLQGWTVPTVVSSTTTLSLGQTSTTNQAVLIGSNANGAEMGGTGEYFLVENRQPTGLDAGLPGCGLLIYHVDERFTNNRYSSTGRLIDVEEAGGQQDLELGYNRGDANDPWHGVTGHTRFAADTSPSSTFYSGAFSGASVTANGACNASMSATMSANDVPPSAPGNDNFAAARSMTPVVAGTISQSTFGATAEAGEGYHAGQPGGGSVWFTWTAPSNGLLSLTTAGSSYDTLLDLYTGDSLAGLATIASNDDESYPSVVTSRVSNIAVTVGTTYRIAVDGYQGQTGSLQLGWSFQNTDPVPPANDNFANAQALTPAASGNLSQSTKDATSQVGEPVHAGRAGGKSVWFTWTAPAAGKLTVSTFLSSYDTLLGVYTGTSVNALTERASNDDDTFFGGPTSAVKDLQVTAGTVYRIAVDGAAGATGDLRLDWTFTQAVVPANDNFASARVLSPAASGNLSQSTENATSEAGEPVHAGRAGGKSVWFTWTAPSAGKLTVSTFQSSYDTLLGVYTGTSVNALTERASNDNDNWSGGSTSEVKDLPVTAGTVYRIAVDGAGGAAGDLRLAWTFTQAVVPANDNFASARVLSPVASGNVSQSTEYATSQVGEPVHAGRTGGASVWFTWTAPAAGKLTVSTFQSSYDTLLGVYTGTSVNALTQRASNDDDALFGGPTSAVKDLPVTAGTVYRIAVDGAGGATGDLRFSWTFTQAVVPANDNFANARALTPQSSGTVNQTTENATAQTGEPLHAGRPGGSSVWFSWTAPATGTLSIATTNSDYDTLLAVYQGTAVNALTPVAANDNDPTLGTASRLPAVAVIAGTTYRIAVDGYQGATGTAWLSWSFTATPKFVSLAPVRVLDTRLGTGAPKALVPAGGKVDLQVTGVGGVPAGAAAVVLNVTAVSPTGPGSGYVTVWPTGATRPTASNLNFVPGQTIPNLVVAKVGAAGKVSLYAAAKTHLIADVAGYYPAGAAFTGVTPVRVLDTRIGTGAPKVRIPAGGTVTLAITGQNGVPANAAAALVNITTVNPSAAGTITAFPAGVAAPNAASVSYRRAQTIAGLGVVKLGTGGKITLRSTAATDLIVDLAGWVPSGGDTVAFSPSRLVSAKPVGSAGSFTVKVAGVGSVPANAKAVQVTVTAVAPSSAGYLTVYPTGGARPVVSNLNYTPGGSISNSAIVKVGTGGTITVYASNATSVTVDSSAYWTP